MWAYANILFLKDLSTVIFCSCCHGVTITHSNFPAGKSSIAAQERPSESGEGEVPYVVVSEECVHMYVRFGIALKGRPTEVEQDRPKEYGEMRPAEYVPGMEVGCYVCSFCVFCLYCAYICLYCVYNVSVLCVRMSVLCIRMSVLCVLYICLYYVYVRTYICLCTVCMFIHCSSMIVSPHTCYTIYVCILLCLCIIIVYLCVYVSSSSTIVLLL